jgi:hypothetical protein
VETTREHAKIDIGQIGGFIAGLSVLALYITAESTFAFARGLLGSLGFPAQIMTLRTGVDFVPAVGEQNAAAFALALLLGFFLPIRQRNERWTYVTTYGVMLLLVVVGIAGEIWDTPSESYSVLLTMCNLFSPLLVGFTYRNYGGEKRFLLAAFALFLALGVHDSALYDQGRRTGIELATRIEPFFPSAEHGLATVKLKDFPIVNVQSAQVLQLSMGYSERDKAYVYSSSAKSFLRLVAYDDSNYYMIENTSTKPRPLAIRKELIQEMEYQTDFR